MSGDERRRTVVELLADYIDHVKSCDYRTCNICTEHDAEFVAEFERALVDLHYDDADGGDARPVPGSP